MHTDYFLYGIRNYAVIQIALAAFSVSGLLLLLKSRLVPLQRHERALKAIFACCAVLVLGYWFIGKNFVDGSESRAAADKFGSKIRLSERENAEEDGGHR
jgi:hypothetical protein